MYVYQYYTISTYALHLIDHRIHVSEGILRAWGMSVMKTINVINRLYTTLLNMHTHTIFRLAAYFIQRRIYCTTAIRIMPEQWLQDIPSQSSL